MNIKIIIKRHFHMSNANSIKKLLELKLKNRWNKTWKTELLPIISPDFFSAIFFNLCVSLKCLQRTLQFTIGALCEGVSTVQFGIIFIESGGYCNQKWRLFARFWLRCQRTTSYWPTELSFEHFMNLDFICCWTRTQNALFYFFLFKTV